MMRPMPIVNEYCTNCQENTATTFSHHGSVAFFRCMVCGVYKVFDVLLGMAKGAN